MMALEMPEAGRLPAAARPRRRWRDRLAGSAPIVEGLSWMVRRKVFPGVAVLCYHAIRGDRRSDGAMAFAGMHVRAARFDEQMRALVRACHPISLDDWRAALAGGPPLPPRAVHVTFDDGYRSVLQEGLPVLAHHGVPATVFVCTGPSTRRERYWHDAVAQHDGPDAVAACKRLPFDEWASRVAGVPRSPCGADDPHAPLTPEEVAQLAAHPLIEIGGHTDSHLILARAPGQVQRDEVARCAAAIRHWTGCAMRAFAYPNGRAGVDFTEETSAILGEAGVEHAFALDDRFAPCDGDPMAHPRFLITAGVTAGHLLHRLARVWQ